MRSVKLTRTSVSMTSNWIWTVIGVCLLLLQQGIVAQFLYRDCGLPGAGIRITQGEDAILGSAPFMAYLMKDNKFSCGGSIVNQRYVLTAAHCAENDMTVRLGEFNTTMNPDCVGMICMPEHEDFGIEFIGVHFGFSAFEKIHDIALIKLDRTITFSENIQPICLHLNPRTARRVNEYKAYGWGLTDQSGTESHVLQKTKLRQYANSYCARKLEMEVTNDQFCAGSQGSDTCSGDSGGPLNTEVYHDRNFRYVQLGIVSYGDPYCTGFGVYTYVPNYGPWILRSIRSHGM